jgi:hypothetical protein
VSVFALVYVKENVYKLVGMHANHHVQIIVHGNAILNVETVVPMDVRTDAPDVILIVEESVLMKRQQERAWVVEQSVDVLLHALIIVTTIVLVGVVGPFVELVRQVHALLIAE